MNIQGSKLTLLVLSSVGAVFLSSCGGSTTSTGDSKRFFEACRASTNMPDEICSCLGEKAEEELTGRSFDFLIATLEQDTAQIEKTRSSLSVEEATKTGLFMVSYTQQCASANAQTD